MSVHCGFPVPVDPEPGSGEPVGTCAWCGDEIYGCDRRYEGEAGLIHREGCMMSMLEETLGVDFLAEACGYKEVAAFDVG